jgi:mRNA interferase MazF
MHTTLFRRGDVVVVRFPYANLQQYKQRPGLVVQDETVHTGLNQSVIALITSNLNRTGPSRVFVPMNSPTGQQIGLLQDSMVVADQIATVEWREIKRSIGHCPDMGDVDSALRRALRLPSGGCLSWLRRFVP